MTIWITLWLFHIYVSYKNYNYDGGNNGYTTTTTTTTTTTNNNNNNNVSFVVLPVSEPSVNFEYLSI